MHSIGSSSATTSASKVVPHDHLGLLQVLMIYCLRNQSVSIKGKAEKNTNKILDHPYSKNNVTVESKELRFKP